MTAGFRLRRLAQRVCCASTLERVIDPLIADLQHEIAAAERDGRAWHARWIRVAGCAAFWRTLALCVAFSTTTNMRRWLTDDDSALGRTVASSAAAIGIATLLMTLLPFEVVHTRFHVERTGLLFLYAIPQAIPLAVVFGLPVGILLALRRRPPNPRIARGVLTVAVVCSAAVFVVSAWIFPASNHAFRQLVFANAARGANELTLPELGTRLTTMTQRGPSVEAAPYAFSYHVRWAASFAPIVLALFALALSSTRRRSALSVLAVVVGSLVYVSLGAVVWIAPAAESFQWLPVFAWAWLPNGVFALLTGLLLTRSNARAIWRTPKSS